MHTAKADAAIRRLKGSSWSLALLIKNHRAGRYIPTLRIEEGRGYRDHNEDVKTLRHALLEAGCAFYDGRTIVGVEMPVAS